MEWTRQTALETLTLPVDATRDLIEETFKKLSNIYDPTQFMTKTEKFIEEIGRPTTKIECDIIFENLNSAYKYLTTMTKKLALERLRLPDNATLDLIKKTYRKLSLIYHSDQCMNQTEKFMPEFGRPTTTEQCDNIFKEINNAYEFLTKTNIKKYEIEIPNDNFKCMKVDQPVEYCFFFYDKYDGEFSYRIPRTLLTMNNYLIVNHVDAIVGENNCDTIWDALKSFFPEPNLLEQKLQHYTTIWYQEKNKNKYFIFLKLIAVPSGYSFSADPTPTEGDDTYHFANLIIKQKLSTGQKYEIEIPNDNFKCMKVDQPVEYCFFFYDKYDGEFSYRIPRTLLTMNNYLIVNHVDAIVGENNCEKIWDTLKWCIPQLDSLQLVLQQYTTIWYQEKNTNKYFIFIPLRLGAGAKANGYSFSADLTEGNNTCDHFANLIIKQKLSTGQKASIVALFTAVTAGYGALGMASYKYAKHRKNLKVHKYLFDKKKPYYFVPLLNDTMMPTESEYKGVGNLYEKTMRMAIPHIPHKNLDIASNASNTKKLLTILDKNADRLFPVPAWKNPSFLENQAKLTTVVLFLNKKNKASKAAITFWEQFEKDKEIRRPDFIEQLNKLPYTL